MPEDMDADLKDLLAGILEKDPEKRMVIADIKVTYWTKQDL